MIPARYLLCTTILFALLGSSPDALAQAPPGDATPHEERRLMVWRGNAGDRINLREIHGDGGFLGVGLVDLTPELRRHFGVPEDRGVMISRVLDGSPAQRAGLAPADIITSIDGESMKTSFELSRRVASATEGSEIALERWRGGERDVQSVPLDTRPRSQVDISPLIVRRIEVAPGSQRIEVESKVDMPVDHRWVERVVETVGDSFSQASFIEQLEALRAERNGLLETLRLMEERLEALEGELQSLHEERPD